MSGAPETGGICDPEQMRAALQGGDFDEQSYRERLFRKNAPTAGPRRPETFVGPERTQLVEQAQPETTETPETPETCSECGALIDPGYTGIHEAWHGRR